MRMAGHVHHARDLLMMTRSKNCDPAIALPQLDIPSIREAFDLLLRIFIVGARQV
jgi:hypothetical protein